MNQTLQRTCTINFTGLAVAAVIDVGHAGVFGLLNSKLAPDDAIGDKFMQVILINEPVPEPVANAREPVICDLGDPETTKWPIPTVETVLPAFNPQWPLTAPKYPPASQRSQEAGRVLLELYVLENGRVGDAKIHESSGYERLDQAAPEEVRRAWRLSPGTRRGRPMAMWALFAVEFKLDN